MRARGSAPFPGSAAVLFRLWRRAGHRSQVELGPSESTGAGAVARPPRFTGRRTPRSTGNPWPSRGQRGRRGCRPTRCCTGRSRRRRESGAAPGRRETASCNCADAAQHADWRDTVAIRAYGKDENVQVACCQALWYGSFRSAPGQFLLIREPGSAKPYDLGLFTLDTQASPEALAERYSWRWAIEPSNATGKQLTGAGEACNRVQEAVERTVPFAFLIQSLMIIWYALACDPAASIGCRRSRCPWYRTKATPAPADMHAALRGELTDARINGISPGHNDTRQITDGTLTSEAAAA